LESGYVFVAAGHDARVSADASAPATPRLRYHLLDNGCPLDVISQILGHDSLDVTTYYAQVSTRLMMKKYNGARPHARG